MTLVVLTGASASGKTSIASRIEALHSGRVSVFYFDSIGVPSEAEMIAQFGSGEAWQQAITFEWMWRLKSEKIEETLPILLEGQTRPSFVAEAAEAAGLTDYLTILIDCDDEIRATRLAGERGQPELVPDHTGRWPAFLRQEAAKMGCEVLDTSNRTLEDCAALVCAHLRL